MFVVVVEHFIPVLSKCPEFISRATGTFPDV